MHAGRSEQPKDSEDAAGGMRPRRTIHSQRSAPQKQQYSHRRGGFSREGSPDSRAAPAVIPGKRVTVGHILEGPSALLLGRPRSGLFVASSEPAVAARTPSIGATLGVEPRLKVNA